MTPFYPRRAPCLGGRSKMKDIMSNHIKNACDEKVTALRMRAIEVLAEVLKSKDMIVNGEVGTDEQYKAEAEQRLWSK